MAVSSVCACLATCEVIVTVPSAWTLHLTHRCPWSFFLGKMSGARIAAPSRARSCCRLTSACHRTVLHLNRWIYMNHQTK